MNPTAALKLAVTPGGPAETHLMPAEAWRNRPGGQTPTPQTAHFTFVDLFAGIGGIRLAFESLGGRCLFTSEWDGLAQLTYRANFGDQPAGDITLIDEHTIPGHDILTAGFPCQPFSIAGVTKHNALGNAHGFAHATQGTLFFDVVRILQAKKPKAFLLENVKNLTGHDHGRTFAIIKATLERELGYYLHYQVTDGRTLTPQHRERVYLVGFREPIPFEFPLIPDLKPRVRDILEPHVDEKYTLTDRLWQYLQDYAARHRARGNGFGYGLVDLDGITRTLSARYYKDGSEILIPQEGKNPRRLTPRECARLMGFPEWFRIVCSDTRAYRQFGNSVVVPVVRLIAQEMVQCLIRASKATEARRASHYQMTLFGESAGRCSNGEGSTTAPSPGEVHRKAGTD